MRVSRRFRLTDALALAVASVLGAGCTPAPASAPAGTQTLTLRAGSTCVVKAVVWTTGFVHTEMTVVSGGKLCGVEFGADRGYGYGYRTGTFARFSGTNVKVAAATPWGASYKPATSCLAVKRGQYNSYYVGSTTDCRLVTQ